MAATVRVCLYLLSLLVATVAAAEAWSPGLLHLLIVQVGLPETTAWWRLGLAGLAGLVYFGLAYLALRFVHRTRYSRELSYQNESGKVSLSLVAIEDALTRAVEGEPGVRKVQCRVCQDRIKRLVLVECILTLWEQDDIGSLNQKYQQILHQRFTELLPHNPVRININVHRLSHRASTYDPEQRPRRDGRTATVMTPGLKLTEGAVDRRAAEELLARSKKATAQDMPMPAGYHETGSVTTLPPRGDRLPTTSQLKRLDEENGAAGT